MRLQVSVARHTLPIVNIVFTTGSGPVPHTSRPTSTIADLLHDVNELVPLESSDGEWGLEDYVVTLASPNSLDGYECFHYQNIHTVLRDDDTIHIRPLSTQDLWQRRINGRHQISADGRHLIDGVAFGKQWLKRSARPGFAIPPRKRRLIEDNGENQETEIQQLLIETGDDRALESPQERTLLIDQGEADVHGANTNALALLNDADDDSEDDEDYLDEDDSDDADSESEDIPDNELESETDMNDHDSTGLPTILDHNDDRAMIIAEDYFEDADEEEADGTIEDIDNVAATVPTQTGSIEEDSDMRGRKRKRHTPDAEESIDQSTWEGFSTPLKHQSAPESNISADVLKTDSAEMDSNSSEQPSHTDTSDSSHSTDDENPLEDDSSEDNNSTSSSSASGESSSSEEEEADSSSASSESVSEATQAEQKKPSVETPATQTKQTVKSVPPGQGTGKTHRNNKRIALKRRLKRLKEQGILSEGADFEDLRRYEDALDETEQMEGVMHRYENAPDDDKEQMEGVEVPVESVEWKRNELLQSLMGDSEQVDESKTLSAESNDPVDTEASHKQGVAATKRPYRTVSLLGDPFDVRQKPEQQPPIEEAAMQEHAPVSASKNVDSGKEGSGTEAQQIEVAPVSISEEHSTPEPAAAEPAPKRARLDQSGAARRMIFGALGLRNPKTPQEEQTLREKLAKRAQPTPTRKQQLTNGTESAPETASKQSIDTWQRRLQLSAVECNDDTTVLLPPPFPFKQSAWVQGHDDDNPASGYQRKHSDGEPAKLVDYSESSQAEVRHDTVDGGLEAADSQAIPDQVPESKTISFASDNNERIPLPQSFEALPDLAQDDLHPGFVIAYKELQLGPNFEPGESSYQVARVLTIGEDDNICVQLSEENCTRVDSAKFDPETGERIYGKFEVPMEEEPEPDHGERELRFADMIQPKLIRGSNIQVSRSVESSGLRGGNAPVSEDNGDDHVVVPESVVQDEGNSSRGVQLTAVEVKHVSTPRAQEISNIMKEAGFESGLDEDLLRPIGVSSSLRRSKSLAKRSLIENTSEAQSMKDVRIADSGIEDQHSDEESSSRQHLQHTRIRKSIEPSARTRNGLRAPLTHSSSLEPTSPVIGTSDGVRTKRVSRAFQSRVLRSISSSSPEMSLHESVKYPQLSQLELDTPTEGTKTTSSNQDAQHAPLTSASQSTSVTGKEEADASAVIEATRFDETSDNQTPTGAAQFDSLPSEVPQSQDETIAPNGPTDDESHAMQSFLGEPGPDGRESSYHESEDNDSESDLLSLDELTSSQAQTVNTRSRRMRVSPPPPKKGLRSSTARKILPTESSPDLPSSQPEIKLSQSQGPRLSQVPAGSQVVDLTFSSDPVSAPSSDSEFSGKRTLRHSRASSSQVGKPKISSSGTGVLGNRKLLTNRKTRSLA